MPTRSISLARFRGEQSASPGEEYSISVADIAALVAFDDAAYSLGETAWTRKLRDSWTLEAPTGIVDGITVVASHSGRQWVRRCLPNRFWQAQTQFYVDEIAGNDENSGIEALPLASYDEYNRRVGFYPADEQGVSIVGDYNGDLDIRCMNDPVNGPFLIVDFSRQVLLDNIIVTSTTPNAATTTGAQTTISSASIPVSWSTAGPLGTTLVGATLFFPDTDQVATVMHDLGGAGHKARITILADKDGFTAEPVAGSSCTAVRYAQALGSVRVTGAVYFTKASVAGPSFVLDGQGPFVWACNVSPDSVQNLSYAGALIGCHVPYGGVLEINGFLSGVASWFPGGLVIGRQEIDSLFSPSGCTFGAQLRITSGARVAAVHSNPDTQAGIGFFSDAALADPILVEQGGVLDMRDAVAYGQGLSGTGVTLNQSSLFLNATNPNLVGCATELSIDGIARTFAAFIAGSATKRITEYTVAGAWVAWRKPPRASMIEICIRCGASGGGGGKSGIAGSNRGGGGSGSCGTVSRLIIPASECPDTLWVYIGRGGNGGAHDAPGQPGEASMIGLDNTGVSTTLLIDAGITGMTGGNAGTAVGGGGGGAPSSTIRPTNRNGISSPANGTAGITGGTAGANGGNSAVGNEGVSPGGSGAGVIAADKAGGTSSSPSTVGPAALANGTGGAAGTNNGVDGSTRFAPFMSTGGGGGGASDAGNGGNGGKGGTSSGGGGGGGGVVGGAGGNGGDGYGVIAVSYSGL